jgi:CheY-like chemotaxis protein
VNSPSQNNPMPVVLVADDSETIQKVVRIALARQPVKVEVAASWNEAQGRLGRQVAVVLLDANLPGVQGDRAKLREALSRAGLVPVVVMQGSHDRSLTDSDLAEAGIKHSIQKPFDSGELIKLITGFVASHATSAPQPSPPPPGGSPLEFPLDSLPPLPPDLVDTSRKGRKAFEALEDTVPFGSSVVPAASTSASASSLPPPPPPPPPTSMSARTVAPQPGAPGADMPAGVREAVLEYCQKHFKEIAVEVISAELRRLAEERARHLVDI